MHELYELDEKVNALIKKHAGLQTDYKKLQQTFAKQANVVQTLTVQLNDTKQQLLAADIANSIHDPAEKKELRKQLDHLINEIDKILSSLND